MNSNPKISLATQIAWSAIWTPYKWGGDDPMAGFDCSGFVIEILQSVGILPRQFDSTAQGLYDRFPKVDLPQEGCLVYWRGSGQRIIHVEYCLDSDHSIGASGGGSGTITVKAAIEQNAYIKIRPFRSRSGLVEHFSDPFKRN